MGIKEAETDFDDSPEAGGKGRVTDPSVRLSIAMLLGAAFFYYMSYNTMTTNISRYADLFFGMGGGTFAVINIVTIVGALASYIPLANLSLKVGRKRVALGTGILMAACPVLIWVATGFTSAFYLVFLVMCVALGAVDRYVYTMIIENTDANNVGRYSGYYYTVSMAAQVATPILSGMVMDVAPAQPFGYITAMGVLMVACIAPARHGDTILIDEAERQEAAFFEAGKAAGE